MDSLWQTHQSGDVLYLVKVERIVARDRAIETSLWLILTNGCKVFDYSTRDALPWEKKSTWHWDYESLLRRTCKHEQPGRCRRDDVEDDDDDVAVDEDDDDVEDGDDDVALDEDDDDDVAVEEDDGDC